MLFNSYEFILLFFPVVFLVFYRLTQHGNFSRALQWLILSSLFFYAWQAPVYLLLLLASIAVNFCASHVMLSRREGGWRKLWLFVGVAVNLLPLAYFKYADFVLQNLHAVGLLSAISVHRVALPLAISFFTFQQIAFLVDAYRTGRAHDNFLEYVFCVVFFPHLIAGPLIYYREFIGQLAEGRQRLLIADNILRGALLFVLGLSKKVLIGDVLGDLVKPVFDGAQGPSGSFDAWAGSIFFGFQIYFDFSAYSDMAIGLAYMFGLRLPINFDSPYRSVTYREFWRRWHVTLFRFFRDHVYTPLMGNSVAWYRRFLLTFLVFFLSGLWHGAGWTFIAWGVCNWLLVVLNDFWLLLPAVRYLLHRLPAAFKVFGGRCFVFVAMSWTFMLFRAPDFGRVKVFVSHAWSGAGLENSEIVQAANAMPMFTLLQHGIAVPTVFWLVLFAFFLLLQVWLAPNAVRLMLAHDEHYRETGDRCLVFRYSGRWCMFMAVLLWASLLALPAATKFIYFQF